VQVLILQFVDPARIGGLAEFSHSIGVMSALLKADGFETALVAMPGFAPAALREAILRQRPQYVLTDLDVWNVSAARRTIGEIAQQYALPVAVFGTYATCSPEPAVSIPGVHALLRGEYEQSAAALLGAMRDGADPAGLEGVWVHTDSGLARGALRAPAPLDSLPFPDRGLFDFGRIVRTTREAPFKVARGCPHWCAYCVNDWYSDLYGDPPVRRRSVSHVLDEIDKVRAEWPGVENVKFYDHAFAADDAWLEEFAWEYPRRCGLPWRCHIRLIDVTERRAELLAAGGCRWTHTHLGSGSRFIREEVLAMFPSDEKIVSACRTLRAAGLRVAGEVFLGSPYESEITLEETLSLVRQAELDAVDPRVFFPAPATRAAELCEENGWISGRGDENYWLGRSVLDMPSLPAAQIDAAVTAFRSLLKRPQETALRRLLDKFRPRGRR